MGTPEQRLHASGHRLDDLSDRSLEALYAQLPRLECKGLCAESCGRIACSDAELERLPAPLTQDEHGYCSFLKDGRCSVYELRPMICRLWGIDETMKCPYGCVPEGGHISELRAIQFLRAALQIGGGTYDFPT